jgi:hypothetical protein
MAPGIRQAIHPLRFRHVNKHRSSDNRRIFIDAGFAPPTGAQRVLSPYLIPDFPVQPEAEAVFAVEGELASTKYPSNVKNPRSRRHSSRRIPQRSPQSSSLRHSSATAVDFNW